MRDISSGKRCVFLIISILAVSAATVSASSRDHRDWSAGLSIYEVNVRAYSDAGTFGAFRAELPRLQEMGVGVLWFMPIHPIGVENRLGSLGSPYSVRDYLDVNPEFGDLDDFRDLVRDIHDRGMFVIIDWVANHTAWDNDLTVEHPEWYVRDALGGFIPPPGTNWTDVIELDYSNPDLRRWMIDAMKFWVTDIGVDGFRCDAVSMVPRDFWEEAIAALKSTRSDLFLLAEADGPEWHAAGFNMTYGWGLYGFGAGVLKRIADGTADADDLNAYAVEERRRFPAEAYRMYFTSNHDENAWHGTTSELFGQAAVAFSVLAATFNGMPLVYGGQEAGLKDRLLFFDKDEIEWRDLSASSLYGPILRLKRENRALWNGGSGGSLTRIPTQDPKRFFAFLRDKDGDRVLAVLNLSDEDRNVTLSGAFFSGIYKNVFNGEETTLGDGSVLNLPDWGYAVFESRAASSARPDRDAPSRFGIQRIYPNPFNSAARISFTIDRAADTRLTVFDSAGREVQELSAGRAEPGFHDIAFDAGGLPSGLYIARLTSGRRSASGRMMLLR